MEMHQVRYFLALSDTLNFTRAAERCNVAQPSLTVAIKKLEAELGGPLFRRERNRSHLTDLGRLMKPHFERIRDTSSNNQSIQLRSKTKGARCGTAPIKWPSITVRENPRT